MFAGTPKCSTNESGDTSAAAAGSTTATSGVATANRSTASIDSQNVCAVAPSLRSPSPTKTHLDTHLRVHDGRAPVTPTGTWVSMQIQHEGRVGPVIRTFVDDSLGIANRHLSFSTSASRADAESGTVRGDTAGTVALSGTAALSGVVLGAADAPVASAEVRVRGTALTTRTDEAGRCSLSRLPAGTQLLEVTRVGYEGAELSVELRSGATTTRDVRLRRVIVTLDSMRVVATRTRSLVSDALLSPAGQEVRWLGGLFRSTAAPLSA